MQNVVPKPLGSEMQNDALMHREGLKGWLKHDYNCF